MCSHQAKQGVISAVGGIPVGKGTLQIQVLNPALSQMPAPQPAAPGPVQTQVLMLTWHYGQC